MASSVQVADLASDIAFRLNLPTFGAGEFITEPQALRLIQQALGRLSGLLTRAYGDGLFTLERTLTTVPDFDLLSLPAGFGTLVSVHWVPANGDPVALARSDLGDLGWDGKAWTTAELPTYRIEGYTLRLFPAPSAAYKLVVRYTGGLTIDSLTDDFIGEPEWADFVVADVCAKIRQREQKPADEFLTERTISEQRILDQAAQRDRGGVSQVRDTYGALSSRTARSWWLR